MYDTAIKNAHEKFKQTVIQPPLTTHINKNFIEKKSSGFVTLTNNNTPFYLEFRIE